jgi:hypothetical protein
MSQEHIEAMNRLLAESDEVTAAAHALDREYVLAYELTDGPRDGATVHWRMGLGPDGTSFALAPSPRADVLLRGDWHTALTAMAHSRRTGEPTDEGLTVDGDVEALMAQVGEQFAVARKVATLDTEFPV